MEKRTRMRSMRHNGIAIEYKIQLFLLNFTNYVSLTTKLQNWVVQENGRLSAMLFVLVADDLDIIIRTLGSMQTNALRVLHARTTQEEDW